MSVDEILGRVAYDRIEFEPGQSEREKIAILRLAGFALLDDTGAIVCSTCGSPAIWDADTATDHVGSVSCSNPACPRKQPPAGTGREEG
jgi:hypothetical protein